MAKGKRRDFNKPRKKVIEDPREEDSVEFTTRSGVKVTLYGLPPLLAQRVQTSVKMPEKPQYSVTRVDGGEDWFDHDPTTLDTDEDKAAWEAYQMALTEAETELTDRLLKTILLESVVVDEGPEFEAWKERQEIIGLELPESHQRLLMHFKEAEVYRTQDDIEFVMSQVLELTGASREAIQQMEDSFPDRMEPESQSGNGDSAKSFEDSTG